jgi:phage gp29-like protein
MQRKNGLYLPDGTFLKFADPAMRDPFASEIAVRSRSIDFYSIGAMYLPNPDPVLKKQGKDIQVYTDLLSDDRVGGSMINRVNATLALDWEIDRGKSSKSRKARFVQEVLAALPLNMIIEHIIRGARGYGYQPMETVWTKRGDGLNAPVAVIAKPQRWFVFGQDNELRFLSHANMMIGEELPVRRFLCPTSEASYDNPYGLGLLSRCFWPVTFKKGGWRFRVKFAEKYGAVWPVGKLPRSAGAEMRDELLDILEQMVSDGVAVIPDDGSVEFLESSSKGGTSDLYHAIIADANTAISTIWLGHAGAGESVQGELGGKEVAMDIRQDIRDSDKTLVEETLNTLIDWICIENWGGAQDAPRFCLWEEEDVDQDQATRDVALTTAMEKSGLKLSRAYYLRTYSLEEGDVEDKPTVTPPASGLPLLDKGGQGGVKFGEISAEIPGEAELDALVESFTPEMLQGVMKGVLKPVFKLFNESGDLTECMGELARLFPRMDAADLQNMLARVIFVSEVWGRLQVDGNA